MAGDSHRALEVPNSYQQIRLACPEFDVVGFTFPGVPGIQHFGHTGAHARADARIVPVGKRGGCRSTPQEFIERVLVRPVETGPPLKAGRRDGKS